MILVFLTNYNSCIIVKLRFYPTRFFCISLHLKALQILFNMGYQSIFSKVFVNYLLN